MKKQACLIGFVFAFTAMAFAQAEKTKKTVIKNDQLYYVHDVIKGQTVYGLCKLYGITDKELYKYNPQVEKGLKLGETLYILISPLKMETYSVKKGDTYYSIAKNRGITEEELQKFNPDKGAVLNVGDVIYVPIVESEENISTTISAPKSQKEERKEGKTTSSVQQPTNKAIVHRVEQGETLYGISKKYDVSVDAIKAANPSLGETLSLGQQIIIPIEQKEQGMTGKAEKPSSEAEETSSAKDKKNEYTVSVLIPLFLSAVDTIEPTRIKSLADYANINSFSFLQFYEGLRLACEDITNDYPNVKIRLNVEDVSSPSQIAELINSGKLEHSDLIIGPFFSIEFSLLCQYAQKKKLVLVNLFSISFETCGSKVYKSATSLYFQGEGMAKYIVSNYENAKIIFANYQGGGESEKINAYKSAMQQVFSKENKSFNIQEINMVNSGIAGIQSAMNGNCENFVFTFFEGELRVTNFVQNLNKAKNSNLTLVAPELWLDYDNIETEYFMNMKTHYLSQYFVDYSNPNVIRFIDAFRDAYDTEPTLELFAFQGYDFTYYFLSNLCENGANFQIYSGKNAKLLSTQFEFVHSQKNMMENNFIHIFKLKDYEYIDATKTK